MLVRMALPALVALFAIQPAAARGCAPVVKDGWLRLPPTAMPMLAGFGRIENPCRAPVAVVGVESDAFGDVSLHETRVVDGVSRMRAIPKLPVAAGKNATLQPGGLHLMLMQPRAPLKAGDAVDVRLRLEDGRTITGRFVVRPIAGT